MTFCLNFSKKLNILLNEGYVTYNNLNQKILHELRVNNDTIKLPKRNRFPIYGP